MVNRGMTRCKRVMPHIEIDEVSDPTTALRYYYVSDARGDVVNLTDATGAVVASYAYDTGGALTSASESIPNANGWVNPYRYDGRDGVRFDAATGLDWMTTRAYDPSLGRFISRDPLGRVPLFLASNDNPYVYAGNNPLSNVDPSGQYRVAGQGATRTPSEPWLPGSPTRVHTTMGDPCANPQSTQCRAIKYAAWATKADSARVAFLEPALTEGQALVAAGAFISAFVDVLELISPSSGVVSRLSAIIDIGLTFTTVFTLLPILASSNALVADILKVANSVAAIARVALGLLQMYGVFAEAAADAAVDAATLALGGWASVLSGVVQGLLGFAFRNFIAMGGHLVMAMGEADLSQYYHALDGNIETWCGQNAGVCPSKATFGL